jgi:ketosteroid isomerase-like protein
MRRRNYIGVLATVGSVTLAGCGSLASLGGPSEPPDEVVEGFIEALDEGDQEEARAVLHSDRDNPDAIGIDWDAWAEADIEVEDSEVVEQGNDEATVEVTYGFDMGSAGVASETTYRFFLRTENGEWRIWGGESV